MKPNRSSTLMSEVGYRYPAKIGPWKGTILRGHFIFQKSFLSLYVSFQVGFYLRSLAANKKSTRWRELSLSSDKFCLGDVARWAVDKNSKKHICVCFFLDCSTTLGVFLRPLKQWWNGTLPRKRTSDLERRSFEKEKHLDRWWFQRFFSSPYL